MFILTRINNRTFSPIYIADYLISIQASEIHFSLPKENLPSFNDYQSFEVAIFYDNRFFYPEKDSRFANKSWVKYWSNHLKHNNNVAAYMPRYEVDKMINDFKSII